MNNKNLRSVDLNLLVVLDVLLEEKHITRAAERLNITQSAMSKSFFRLKEMFDDPILDRVSGEYELTVRGTRLVQPVKEALNDIQGIINSIQFDPKTTKRTFVISTLDYAELIVSDKFMKLLGQEAPNSKITFMSRTQYAFDHLVKGICDAITLDDFLSFPHCILKTDFDEPMVDIALAAINKTRKITKESPNFVASITSLKGTNMIICVPESAARAAKSLAGVVINDMPFEVPELTLCLMWHKRNKDRPGHLWFREQLKTAFKDI